MYKLWTLVAIDASQGHWVTVLKPFYMNTGIEKSRKQMADGRTQVFHCWEWKVTDKKAKTFNMNSDLF